MEKHLNRIETRLASVERTGEALVEVRIKPDVRLDAEGLGEMVRAKHRLCAEQPADILLVFPSEVDFDLNVLSMDHRALHGGCGLAGRLALAAQSAFNERLAGIYFRYHPRDTDTAVFVEEGDARAWLVASVSERSLS